MATKNSCSLSCNVVGRDGKVKTSKLWSELLKFFKKDRREALAHYFLTKDSNFLMENSDVLEFDVDGEVTLTSLKKALDKTGEYNKLSDNVVLQRLNEELQKEIRGKNMGYSEALDNVMRFNRSDKFRENFMATMTFDPQTNKYSISVVERSPEAESALADHVANRIMTDAIRVMLQDKGLSVDFLDNPSYGYMYNTVGATKSPADGLYAVISVLDGNTSSRNLAEAAGHFIVDVMKDSPLLERLLNFLTPEVQEALFKQYGTQGYRKDFITSESENSRKEAAGILIGNELIKPFREANTSLIKRMGRAAVKFMHNLVSRIVNNIKKAFSSYKPSDVDKLIKNAQAAAATVAQGFINDPSLYDTQNALLNPKVITGKSLDRILSDKVKAHVENYNKVLGELKAAVTDLKILMQRTGSGQVRELHSTIEKLVQDSKDTYLSQMSSEHLARMASIQGMTELLSHIANVLDTEVRELLDSIQPADTANAYTATAANARNMNAVNTLLIRISSIYSTMQNILANSNVAENVTFPDANGNMVVTSLKDAVTKLGEILVGNQELYKGKTGEEVVANGLQGVVEAKRRQIYLDAMKEFFGKDYIEIAAGRVWHNMKIMRTQPQVERVEDYMEMLMESSQDIGWFDRYFASAADSGDFFVAVGDKATKLANMTADRIAMNFWDRIEALELQMKDAFGDTDFSRLLETITDEDGHILRTGNFLSEDHYGQWEQDRDNYAKELRTLWHEHLAKFRKEKYEQNKGKRGYVFKLSDNQRAILYHQFVDRLWEKWHAEHSEKDTTGRWVPNKKKYHDSRWDELFDTKNPGLTEEERNKRQKQLVWYNEFMALKDDMDALLPQGATVRWRAPQMVGRWKHRYRNTKLRMKDTAGKTNSALGRSLRMQIATSWAVNENEAWMYGSNNEFNEITDDPLENPMFFERDTVNRIPLYGINKLKNMDELSTDIFGTMLAYGSMAATHNCLESVADFLELGKSVLKDRKVNGVFEKQRGEQSRAYSRYIKFLEKSVYGKNVVPIIFSRAHGLRKFINNLSSIGGRVLLWGNVHGGIVNTGTGFFEMFKEALAGENYNFKEFSDAHKMYFKDIVEIAMAGLSDAQRPQNKTSLWIRHWNILSENRAFLHNQKYDTKAMSLIDHRLWDWFGHTMMLPYSSGEHYMQTIPYLAMGMHTKVYDKNGNQIRLIDAYDVVDGQEVFAVEKEDGDEPLGKTPKKIQLKDEIFRSPEDIIRYNKVVSMLNRIANYYANHLNSKPTDVIALNFFSEEEQDYLRELNFGVPQNAKQLASLENALKIKRENLKYNSVDESEFMNKCRNITNRLHGIYNTEDRVAFQQNFYGNLVMSMRGYALGMANRRYASNTYNLPQGKNTEGNYNTAFKALVMTLTRFADYENWLGAAEATFMTLASGMLGGLPLYNISLFEKWQHKIHADMKRAGFNDNQYYNMRRTAADFAVFEMLTIANLLSSPGMHQGLNDDKKKKRRKDEESTENWIAGLVYYFTMRWFNEQSAMGPLPFQMAFEATQLLDYVPVGASGFWALFDDIFIDGLKYAWDVMRDAPESEKKKNSDLYYQTSKEGKYQKGDSKWFNKFRRLTPYLRSYYVFQDGYEAAASYEYGRRIRGK